MSDQLVGSPGMGCEFLDCGLPRMSSPQARVYELDGHVLLLGVGHENNTSLHLSEYLSVGPDAPRFTHGAPLLIDGARRWVTFDSLVVNDEDFHEIGMAFAAEGRGTSGPVGESTGHLMRSRDIVDFGAVWMRNNRA